MAKSLTLKKLEQDKKQMLQMAQEARGQAAKLQMAAYGLDRILDYINDNIKALKGEKDDR